MDDAQSLRYPIGLFIRQKTFTNAERQANIRALAEAPLRLRLVAESLSESQLDTPYRSGGWTARQVVHHLPDSHMNAYTRIRLALTEEYPVIKPYDEAAWAGLPDRHAPVAVSLRLLEALHERWVLLLEGLTGNAWKHAYRHPVAGPVTVEQALAEYVWHGRHHTAHVELVQKGKERRE